VTIQAGILHALDRAETCADRATVIESTLCELARQGLITRSVRPGLPYRITAEGKAALVASRPSEPHALESIVCEVASRHGLRRSDLIGRGRTSNLGRVRVMAMALAYELTGASLTEVGAFFGGRDFTTVRYAVRRLAVIEQTDERARLVAESIRMQLAVSGSFRR